jgi:hypothetical protein
VLDTLCSCGYRYPAVEMVNAEGARQVRSACLIPSAHPVFCMCLNGGIVRVCVFVFGVCALSVRVLVVGMWRLIASVGAPFWM